MTLGPVLLVDDSRAARIVASLQLSRLGYEVHEAADPLEAMAVLAGARRFSMVLTDIMMPRMSGISFIRLLRNWQGYVDVPIFVISVDPSPEMIQQLQSLGVLGILQKPFEGEEFESAISGAIAAGRLSVERPEPQAAKGGSDSD